MKKLFYVLMASLVVAGMVSCNKPAPTVKDKTDEGSEQKPEGGDNQGGDNQGGDNTGGGGNNQGGGDEW